MQIPLTLFVFVRFALPRKDCDEFIDCHYSERNRHFFKIKYQIFHTKDIFKLARRDDLLELKFM